MHIYLNGKVNLMILFRNVEIIIYYVLWLDNSTFPTALDCPGKMVYNKIHCVK